MGYWTELSIEYANQRSYLDELYRIYPSVGMYGINLPRKKSEQDILLNTPSCNLIGNNENNNMLIKGNNLNVLQLLRQSFNLIGKIDLIYIDPPFATNTVFT